MKLSELRNIIDLHLIEDGDVEVLIERWDGCAGTDIESLTPEDVYTEKAVIYGRDWWSRRSNGGGQKVLVFK